MQSPEGSAFWELIQSSVADVKIGGMGVVMGFDTQAILKLAEIKKQDLQVAVELLPYANAGLLRGTGKNKDDNDGD